MGALSAQGGALGAQAPQGGARSPQGSGGAAPATPAITDVQPNPSGAGNFNLTITFENMPSGWTWVSSSVGATAQNMGSKVSETEGGGNYTVMTPGTYDVVVTYNGSETVTAVGGIELL